MELFVLAAGFSAGLRPATLKMLEVVAGTSVGADVDAAAEDGGKLKTAYD